MQNIQPVASTGCDETSPQNATIPESKFFEFPPDRSICADCLNETRDPSNRRYRYSFTTCSQCGPRYSIQYSTSTERSQTTMQSFEMCEECEQEYHDPQSRRFHAQTIVCPHCGPLLWSSNGNELLHIRSREALNAAADCLRRGQVLALRGVGGYQLLVDATSSAAVSLLRRRKKNPVKPLAVLCRTLDEARELAEFSELEAQQLCSLVNPIVLVRQRKPSNLAPQINPGLSDIGLMLPAAALHDILLERVKLPLAFASGNLPGEPVIHRIDDAEARLQNICDLFLHHDREIHRPIDDSVVRVIENRPVTIRPARGLTPFPLTQPDPETALRSQSVIACGSHRRGAFAMSCGSQAVMSPHIGNLDELATQERWDEQLREFAELAGDRCGRNFTSLVACDCASGTFPAEWADSKSASPISIGHHHALVAAGMWERGWLDRQVLGIAWDCGGTGADGTEWGGEFLRASTTEIHRLAHLRPFVLATPAEPLDGVKETAFALLSQLEELTCSDLAFPLNLSESDVRRRQQISSARDRRISTSCGILFDVAACLILDLADSAFEGQSALSLESACDPSAQGLYPLILQGHDPVQLDWRPMIRQILADRRSGVASEVMAMRFHRGLAKSVIDISNLFPDLPVVLSGNLFENRILVELIAARWDRDPSLLGLPGRIPPNDSGLSAGQLAIALATSRTHTSESEESLEVNMDDSQVWIALETSTDSV